MTRVSSGSVARVAAVAWLLCGICAGEEKRLTQGSNDCTPVWSHDGRRIFFLRDEGEQGWRLHVMNANGTGDRQIGPSGFAIHDVSPTPDGAALVVGVRRTGAGEEGVGIGLLPLATPDEEHLRILWEPTQGGSSAYPRCSPDGNRIAFLCGSEDQSEVSLWVMDLHGREVRQVSQEPLSPHGGLSWSPDGARVAVTSEESCHIRLVDMATGTVETVHRGSKAMLELAWSPRGDSLLYAQVTDLRRMPIRLMEFDLDDSKARPVLPPPRTGDMPAWSPAGDCIAFSRFEGETEEDGRSEIYVVEFRPSALREAGGQPKEGKVEASAGFFVLHWGSETAAAKTDSPQTGAQRQLADLCRLHRCSADGSTWEALERGAMQYVRSPDRESQAILRSPPTGGLDLTLTRIDGTSLAEFQDVRAFAFSADSRRLGMILGDKTSPPRLVLAGVEGGEQTVHSLGESLEGYSFLDLAWSPSGNHLFFLPENHRLVLISAASGEQKTLGMEMEILSAAWGPRGETILASAHNGASCELVRLGLDGTGTAMHGPGNVTLDDLVLVDEKRLFFTRAWLGGERGANDEELEDTPPQVRGTAVLFDLERERVIREFPGPFFATAVSPEGDAFVGLRYDMDTFISRDTEFYGMIVRVDMKTGRERVVVKREPLGGQMAVFGLTQGISKSSLRPVRWR